MGEKSCHKYYRTFVSFSFPSSIGNGRGLCFGLFCGISPFPLHLHFIWLGQRKNKARPNTGTSESSPLYSSKPYGLKRSEKKPKPKYLRETLHESIQFEKSATFPQQLHKLGSSRRQEASRVGRMMVGPSGGKCLRSTVSDGQPQRSHST